MTPVWPLLLLLATCTERLIPVVVSHPLNYGACYGQTDGRAENVLLTCDDGLEILAPWSILQKYGWGR